MSFESENVGFYLYALEYAEVMHKNGHEIYEFKKICSIALPHWKKLSTAEREDYEEIAGFEFIFDVKKMTFNGLNYQDYIELRNTKKYHMKIILKDIHQMIDENFANLDNFVFHLVSASNFYTRKQIYPAEISFVKFSLSAGIIEELNILVKPGKFPFAISNEIHQNAETLRLNSSLENEEESDYFDMFEEILMFLSPLESLPIFFADDDVSQGNETLTVTRRIFDHIFFRVQEDEIASSIKVYPIRELFSILMKALSKKRNWKLPDPKLYEGIYLTQGCDVHNQKNAAYVCCLSKVRRMSYLFSKYCCDETKYELKPGKHFPVINEELEDGI